jgi:hypothetical protein
MERSFDQNNQASRDRLVALVQGLTEESLQQQTNDDWTIAATLAHIAFWDRMCLARWDAFDAGAQLTNIPSSIIDLVNAANLPLWRALSGRAAVDLLMQATRDFDQRIGTISDGAVQAAISGGFESMLDRSRHRNAHAAEIEAI